MRREMSGHSRFLDPIQDLAVEIETQEPTKTWPKTAVAISPERRDWKNEADVKSANPKSCGVWDKK